MKLRDDGCVLCGSTWGDVWAEMEGQRRFFCCRVCALQFGNLLTEIRKELGETVLRSLAIEGGRRGRIALVEQAGRVDRFAFLFGGDGEVRRFRRLTPPT